MMSTCNSHTWDTETSGLDVQGHPQIHNEFRANLATGDPPGSLKKAESMTHGYTVFLFC